MLRNLSMKKKIIILAVAVILTIILGSIAFGGAAGRTMEERQEQLCDVPNGEGTVILGEITNRDYVIAAIRGADGRDGLAIFKPVRNGRYNFMSWIWYEPGDIVWMSVPIEKVLYNYFWLDRDDLAYAEVTYTIDGVEQETIRLDCGPMPIVYTEGPDVDYDLHVVFYDEAGNAYE